MVAIPRPAPLPIPGFRRPVINWYVVATALLAGTALAMPVMQASTTTEAGFEAERLRDQRVRLEDEINALEGEIATLTSHDRVEQRARALGFAPADFPLHVTVTEPGPGPARVPSEYFAAQP